MPDTNSIRHYISTYPSVQVGFTIYRLTYSDNGSWTRYMHHLNERVRLNLEEDGDGDNFPYIHWDVQEDPELKGAEDETVRDGRFKTYVAQHPDHARFGGLRFEACVAVRREDVDEVLSGLGPEVWAIDDTGCFWLIALEEEDGEQGVAFLLLFPRVFSSMQDLGWDLIHIGDDAFAQ
ncbi:hypothetical protein G6514_000770 [Epicoccum nigrum]|nr:hypothetical protein G6514_000770 [Epicoccum nigrum]